MSEAPADLTKLGLEDFETEIPDELGQLDDAYGELEEALKVFTDDSKNYAKDGDEETRDALEVGVSSVTQRVHEAVDVIFHTFDTTDFTSATKGMLLKTNATWVDTFNKPLTVNEIKLWDPDYIQTLIEEALEKGDTSEDVAKAIATQCGSTLETDLNYFTHFLKEEAGDLGNVLRFFVGRTATEQLFDMEDGTRQLFLYHPFRIEPPIDVVSPDAWGEDFQFTFSDGGGTEGKFWIAEAELKDIVPEDQLDFVKKALEKRIKAEFNALGDKTIEIVYTDPEFNGEPDEFEELDES